MRKIILALMLLTIAATGCKKECSVCKEDDSESRITVGDPAPKFTITDIDATKMFDSSAKGKRVLIYFLWSECSDCHKATANVMQLWRTINNDPTIELVCIARGAAVNATLQQAHDYWQSVKESVLPIAAPKLYYDTDRLVYSMFALSGVPRFYIVDPQGVVRWKSDTIATAEQLEKALETLK